MGTMRNVAASGPIMRRMAVVNGLGVSGRTGNQIAQIATTIAMADRYGMTPAIHRDWAYRHVYNVPDGWYTDDRTRLQSTRVESCTELDDLSAPLKDYLQDLRWWGASIDTIRDVFTLKPEPRGVVTRSWNRTFAHRPKRGVVHVRRGDNVTNDPGTINCLPESYYRDGMARFPSVESWLVFTDDPDWCRDRLGGSVATVWDGVPRSKEHHPDYATETVLDWIDHALMVRAVSSGAPFVMSNSSYALTVAVLAGARRNVVYPSYWYGDVLVDDLGARPDLLFPDWLASDWTRLHVDDPNPRTVGP